MDSFEFPEWYKSSAGPGTSKTLFNIAAAFLPVLNMFLQSTGHSITVIPDQLSSWISLAVFTYFAIQAGIGYVRSKTAAEAKMKALASLGGINHADFSRITRV